jgi:hypothetical protein
LDAHFGINEITSYGVISYKKLEKTLQDKQVKSGVYKALEKQRMAIKKQLMDVVKITSRNVFYLQFQPFKEGYDNFRDDPVLFRHLTRAHGLIQQQGEKGGIVNVLLLTEAEYPPKVSLIIEGLLNQLNKDSIAMPDNSGRILQFHLRQNDQIVFAVKTRKTVAA